MDSTAATGEAPSVSAAKKPTAKEKLEAEIRAGIEQTRKNLELAASASEGGSESDNHWSEDGVPPEVAAEDVREAEREEHRIRMEENYREREREELEEEAAEVDRDDSSVEEIEDAFPHCPPPADLTDQEKGAWEDTVALVKHCRKTGTKVPVKIPSDLDGKWNKAQKLIWAAAKTELQKVERRMAAVRRRAAVRKSTKVVDGGHGKEGHTEDPEAIAAAGGKNALNTLTTTLHSKREG
jgi:hypothetical protein